MELSAYIVNFYVGNDFLDAAMVLERSGTKNPRPRGYRRRLNALPKGMRMVAPQHLNQS